MKFKSDIETQAGLIDSFGFSGSAGQILSSTGTKTEWITPPQSPGGGGSSQVFYFNGGTASSVGGYYQMSPVANTSTGADFTINANGYIASFLTDVNSPNQLNIPAGNWNFEIYFSASSGGGSPSFYVELYKYSSSTFTLIASSSATPEGITNGTAIDLYITALAVPTTTLLATDRLAVRVYVTHSGRTIKMHTQNGHLSEVITTFSTGLTALNGLTEQVQYFATGAGGTDFNIASAVNTHTFNLPTASATNRGALSSADWITFNSKANASGTTNYVSKFTGTTTLGNSQIFDNGTNVGIGTASPIYKLDVNGTISTNSFFRIGDISAQIGVIGSATSIFGAGGNDWTFYNGAATSNVFYTSGTERMRITSAGNVGIGTSAPARLLELSAGEPVLRFNPTTVSGAYIFSAADGKFYFTPESSYVSTMTFSSGNVGIGTTSPSAFGGGGLTLGTSSLGKNLIINSSANGSTGLLQFVDLNGNNSLQIFGGSTEMTFYGYGNRPMSFYTNDAERMRITSGGNVGIGTSSPTGKLNVLGSGTTAISISNSTPGTSSTPELTQLNFLGYAQENRGRIEATDIASSANGSELRFYNANTSNVLTERMRIASTGSIKFNNYGSGTFTGTATQKLAVDSSGNIIEIPIGAGPVDGSGTTNYVTKWTDADTIGNSIMYDNGTNVGIGTSSPTLGKLVSKDSGYQFIAEPTDTATYGYLGIGQFTNGAFIGTTAGSNSASDILRLGTSGTERMRITSAGNVGIGTSSPSEKLTLSGGALRLESATGVSSYVHYISPGNDEWSAGMNGAYDFQIAYSNGLGTPRMTLLKGGNVGIGTSSPLYKTDISGNLRFSTGYLNSDGCFERIFLNSINFPDGTANLAADIILGNISFWGYIEVEVVGAYTHQSTSGKLTKIFAVGTNPGNLIYVNESRVSDAMGTIDDNIAIGDMSWDATNSRYRIPISHIVSTGNPYTVRVKMLAHDVGAKNVFDNISIGSNYTLTALAKQYPYYNDRLGIGTSSPEVKLDILGSGTVQSRVQSTSGGDIRMSADSIGRLGTYSNSDLLLLTNGSNRMTITSAGNVGIGTTTPLNNAGSTAMQIVGADYPLFTITSSNQSINTQLGVGFNSGYAGTSTNHPFNIITNGNLSTSFTASGNVGIGTSSPSQKLEVVGNAVFRSTQRIDISTAQPAVVGLLAGSSIGTYGNFSLISSSGTAGESMDISYWNGSTYYSAFGVANVASGFSNLLLMKNGGNVGIGTTSPGSKLDVDANGYSIIANNGTGNRSLYLGTNGGEPSIQATLSNGNPRQLSLNPSGGNVGINTTAPNNSAILHLRSTTQGFLPPVMRTGERNGISSPAIGLMIFNEEDDAVQVYTGGGWKTLAWA